MLRYSLEVVLWRFNEYLQDNTISPPYKRLLNWFDFFLNHVVDYVFFSGILYFYKTYHIRLF